MTDYKHVTLRQLHWLRIAREYRLQNRVARDGPKTNLFHATADDKSLELFVIVYGKALQILNRIWNDESAYVCLADCIRIDSLDGFWDAQRSVTDRHLDEIGDVLVIQHTIDSSIIRIRFIDGYLVEIARICQTAFAYTSHSRREGNG